MEATFRLFTEDSAVMAALSASDQERLNSLIRQGTQAIQIQANTAPTNIFDNFSMIALSHQKEQDSTMQCVQ